MPCEDRVWAASAGAGEVNGVEYRVRRGRVSLALGVLMFVASCGDLEVVTASYATLDEAIAAEAVDRGWLPRGLPRGSHDIREAHDLDSNRRWGLFEFPQAEAPTLQALLDHEVPFGGQRVNPPRRIEWWPVLLRGSLDHDQLIATGLRAYQARDGDLVFAVNWKQGRAYYWSRE